MKKLLLSLAAAGMLLSLSACGGAASMTVDEMVEQAETVSGDAMYNAVSNVAKAQTEYCGQLIQVEGQAEEIGADYVVLRLGEGIEAELTAHVPSEELAELAQSQTISVVGTVDEELGKTQDALGFETMMYTMSDAHVSKTTVEWTGIIRSENSSFEHGYNLKVGGSSYLRLVYFEGHEAPEINGEEITVSGIVIADQMHHGVIVE